MKILKGIFYYFFLITAGAGAQVRKIQCLSNENQQPLKNVEVYDGNVLIGKSDLNGYFDLKTGTSNYLHLIREEYKDSFVKAADLQKTVVLIKNKPIELEEVLIGRLNEVVISRIGIKKLLKRVHYTLEHDLNVVDPNKYKLPDYYHVTNQLLTEKDTLHYLNALMTYVPDKGDFINENFRLVRKFKFDSPHHGFIYSINKKNANFYGDVTIRYLTVPYSFDNDYLLVGVLKNNRNYKYKLTNIGGFYRVEFESKNDFFSFSGYLIVDKADYGIYEFKAHLSDSPKNIEKSVILESSTEQTYHVTTADYFTKYERNSNGIYEIVESSTDKQFEQIQGNFKGKKFQFSSRMEADEDHKNFEFMAFDPYTYELKSKTSIFIP